MKIRILTQPLGHNIGGILQNYALITVCKAYFDDVKSFNIPFSIPFLFPILKYGACVKRLFIKLFINHNVVVRWWLENRIRKPQKGDLIDVARFNWLCNHDFSDSFFVFGSDQVWRKEMSPDIMTFFGSFLKDDVPRIAYAASFGVDYWQFSTDETKKIIPLLKKFRAISVREESAVRLLAEHGVDSQLVLDPTMLLKADDYAHLESEVSCDYAKANHIFVYCLDEHLNQKDVLCQLEQTLNVPLLLLNEKNLQVDMWLSALRTAEYVITDSFHGTVFSILFHKKFIVVANEYRGLTRLQSLLKMFGLENRLIMSFEDFDCEKLDAEIDYKSVDVILNQEREKSLTFLSESLSS
ncbi:polysaccharide pyruvyl transferase family protein [Fibrobacter sp. UWB12]|uniref:polysaccharide pyruvyl transferase family protein n=1 Tax=Fibrobacter sp. UWB12 TaxID=1896203 RepID=UPI000922C7FA|nr:polysaccharide pyruvyl transferase family protein [Fibrobacter sp. UWB12]SHK89494.1 Polysaccharide pyruvyl transferase [Fibrobacter sp. UWB12]